MQTRARLRDRMRMPVRALTRSGMPAQRRTLQEPVRARMEAGSRMPAETRVETGISSRGQLQRSVSEPEPAVQRPVSESGQQYGGQYQNQQYYNPYQNTAGRKKQGQGFGIASLVLGILALVLFCTCINVFFGILSLIFGIIQIVRYEKKGLAIGGIVTSVISVILMFICWGMLLTSDEFIRTLQDELRYYEQYDLDNEMDRFLDDEYLNYHYEDEIMDHHTLVSAGIRARYTKGFFLTNTAD